MVRKNKRGQVSIEIMYSIGVLLLIFILLTAVTFSKRVDVRKTDETVKKKNDCNEISSALNRILALGDGYSTDIYTPYNLDLFEAGLIVIGDPGVSSTEIELVCTFEGILAKEYRDLTGSQRFNNTGGIIWVVEF